MIKIKEPVNSLSHLAGVLFSVAGLIVLILLARGRPLHIFVFSVYGASLILLYTASTLLHSLPVSPRIERSLRRFDHSAIFLLIAGTYTPVCLVTLRGVWGWSLFGIVWALAAAGILFKVFFLHAPKWLSTVLYVAMGWLALVAIVPLMLNVPPLGLVWLFSGGVFYSAGALIYGLERPNLLPGILGHHEVFHFLVLAGSACHFVFMLRYVLPHA